jgi:hypothetical protein
VRRSAPRPTGTGVLCALPLFGSCVDPIGGPCAGGIAHNGEEGLQGYQEVQVWGIVEEVPWEEAGGWA